MPLDAHFAHVNLIAQDWRRLAAFYQRVFGCIPVPPERHLSGAWLDAATSLPQAEIHGLHLRLPGSGANGPTLEIFQYTQALDHPPTTPRRPGWGHLAFRVADVRAACEAVFAAGGHALGEIVTTEIPGAGCVTFAYVADPEGNLIELQRWEH